MKKICIISNLHLSTNPRVWKEANTLAAAGYETVILTVWTSEKKRKEDAAFVKHSKLSYKAALNINEVSLPKRLYYKAIVRLGQEMKKKFNIDSSFALGYGQTLLKKEALKANADLYIAHTEYGMLVGRELIKKNKRVAFDFEDWYSHDYIVPSRPFKLLRKLEKFALENGVYCSFPSKAMATGVEEFYNSNKSSHVIYNGFSTKENIVSNSDTKKNRSIIWFSQTIGPGRGLETLFTALSYLDTKVEVHLLGLCDDIYRNKLMESFPGNMGHSLFFHSPVPHSDLISVLKQHSIGLAIEDNYPESRNTTITNKILQYIQAGIKVLATSTKGQAEVAGYFPGDVELVPFNDPKKWAMCIEQLLSSPPINKELQFQKFKDIFSWEAQEQKLLNLISNNTA